MATDSLFRSDVPVVPIRGVHLDLKGVPPTAERLLELLKIIAAARYNAVLVEWEDAFPWTADVRFRSETAYTPDQVRRFHAEAAGLGIEVIPLVQCLGHMETPLSVADYRPLREVPHRSDVLNPLAPGARDLVQRMVDDVIALAPADAAGGGLKHFHLGGDEAWSFGTHPDTRAYIEQHGKGALYLRHVEPTLDALNQRGIRPILWHDMMRDWDGESLRRLAAKADLMMWGYGGDPLAMRDHCNADMMQRFLGAGFTLWGATAYKGGDGHDADLPDLARRQENALGWAGAAARYPMRGIVATAWSRYSTHNVQCEPIDAALDSLVTVGVILHDGAPPEHGVQGCVAALEALGERDRFEACRDAMRKLSDARRRGWTAVAHLRQAIVTATEDGRRRGSGVSVRRLEALRQALAQAEEAADLTRRAFAGLMEPLWTERYLNERIAPLREELGALEARVRLLEPEAYDAH